MVQLHLLLQFAVHDYHAIMAHQEVHRKNLILTIYHTSYLMECEEEQRMMLSDLSNHSLGADGLGWYLLNP